MTARKCRHNCALFVVGTGRAGERKLICGACRTALKVWKVEV